MTWRGITQRFQNPGKIIKTDVANIEKWMRVGSSSGTWPVLGDSATEGICVCSGVSGIWSYIDGTWAPVIGSPFSDEATQIRSAYLHTSRWGLAAGDTYFFGYLRENNDHYFWVYDQGVWVELDSYSESSVDGHSLNFPDRFVPTPYGLFYGYYIIPGSGYREEVYARHWDSGADDWTLIPVNYNVQLYDDDWGQSGPQMDWVDVVDFCTMMTHGDRATYPYGTIYARYMGRNLSKSSYAQTYFSDILISFDDAYAGDHSVLALSCGQYYHSRPGANNAYTDYYEYAYHYSNNIREWNIGYGNFDYTNISSDYHNSSFYFRKNSNNELWKADYIGNTIPDLTVSSNNVSNVADSPGFEYDHIRVVSERKTWTMIEEPIGGNSQFTGYTIHDGSIYFATALNLHGDPTDYDSRVWRLEDDYETLTEVASITNYYIRDIASHLGSLYILGIDEGNNEYILDLYEDKQNKTDRDFTTLFSFGGGLYTTDWHSDFSLRKCDFAGGENYAPRTLTEVDLKDDSSNYVNVSCFGIVGGNLYFGGEWGIPSPAQYYATYWRYTGVESAVRTSIGSPSGPYVPRSAVRGIVEYDNVIYELVLEGAERRIAIYQGTTYKGIISRAYLSNMSYMFRNNSNMVEYNNELYIPTVQNFSYFPYFRWDGTGIKGTPPIVKNSQYELTPGNNMISSFIHDNKLFFYNTAYIAYMSTNDLDNL